MTLIRASMHSAVVLVPLLLAACAGVSDPTGLFGKSGADSGAAAPATAPTTLPERAADVGPAAATAVVEASYTLDGLIMPVARGQTRTETRADMRRTDSAVTFDNWLVRRFAGDGRSSEIVRIDRKLVWNLQPAKQQYTECPLAGCVGKAGKPDEPAQPEQPNKPAEPTCPVSLKANDLKVDATGERRSVNGFATERYQITWTLEIEDGAGRRNSNRVQLDLWTTPETGPVREVQAIDETFGRRHATALTAGENPVGRYLPHTVAAAMSTLMNRLDSQDTRGATRFASELKKVRGYPIVTTMTWVTQGAVCSDSGGASPQATAAGIGGMLSGMLGGRKADGGAPAPLISFNQEVKTLAVKPVPNSAFAPPAEYTRSN